MGFQLRDYQKEAIQAVIDARRNGQKRLLISLPTGAGKTVIFSELCRMAQGHVLVLAHREELLSQARDKIFSAANKSFPVEIEQADRTASPHSKVVVASIRSLNSKRLRRLLKEHHFRLIIYDESHHAAAEDNKRVLSELGCFKPDWNGTLVGFTATANRADGIGLDEIFERIVYQRSIIEMIRDQFLVPLRGYRINTSVDLHNILKDTGDYTQEDLSEAVNIESRNALVARSIQELARDRRTIVFCVSVTHAIEMARALNTLGITTAPVYGHLQREKRAERLKRFKDGQYMALTNVGVLTEGFDDPGVSCIAMARPTKSESLYAQCIGRGARLAPNKADCLILDFVDLSNLSLITLPSLLGLPKELNLKGEDLTDAIEVFEQLQINFPGFEVVPGEITLNEIKRRAESFDPLTMAVNPEITAITANGWCSLGSKGLALYYFDNNELCCATITCQSKRKRKQKKYCVEINNQIVAEFSKILDAVEATDYELSKLSEQAELSARDNAPWRETPITDDLKHALSTLSPPRQADNLGDALAYLIFADHHPTPQKKTRPKKGSVTVNRQSGNHLF